MTYPLCYSAPQVDKNLNIIAARTSLVSSLVHETYRRTIQIKCLDFYIRQNNNFQLNNFGHGSGYFVSCKKYLLQNLALEKFLFFNETLLMIQQDIYAIVPLNIQLKTYYLSVCYLIRIQQYPVNTTYNRSVVDP